MKTLSQIRKENKEELLKEFEDITHFGCESTKEIPCATLRSDLIDQNALSESRIISAIREWAASDIRQVKYDGGTDISKILKEGAENYGYNRAKSDLLSYLNEADKK